MFNVKKFLLYFGCLLLTAATICRLVYKFSFTPYGVMEAADILGLISLLMLTSHVIMDIVDDYKAYRRWKFYKNYEEWAESLDAAVNNLR